MSRRNPTPDLLADPFGESLRPLATRRALLLGARFMFASDSPELLDLVDSAYAGLPGHRLSARAPRLRIDLKLGAAARSRGAPPPLEMISGAGFLGGATQGSSLVLVSPAARSALVAAPHAMLRYPYHTRYELIEFAVFTLAARAQGLISLHGACVGRRGRCVLLVGPTGSGKSTVTLQCLLAGFEMVSEDSVFVAARTMRATGVANFLHVTADTLRWIDRRADRSAIRAAPVIRRRSGIAKFEVDLRDSRFKLACTPPKVAAVVFLSTEPRGRGPLLETLSVAQAGRRLRTLQAYAANQPGWGEFSARASRLPCCELRRGRHPREAVDALRALLDAHPRTSPTVAVKVWRK